MKTFIDLELPLVFIWFLEQKFQWINLKKEQNCIYNFIYELTDGKTIYYIKTVLYKIKKR